MTPLELWLREVRKANTPIYTPVQIVSALICIGAFGLLFGSIAATLAWPGKS